MHKKIELLKNCKNIKDLSDLLDIPAQIFSYNAYFLKDNQKYIFFEIPKKNGGKRKITAPINGLKEIQQKINNLLLFLIDDNKNNFSHAFIRKNEDNINGIFKNAQKHTNKRYVFNIDLKDFFPSIHYGRIKGFLEKDKRLELDPVVAAAIAKISCYNGHLPQGSPCSPIISELIASNLDIKLYQLAKKYKCTYSRYADDITFSTNLKKFPEDICILNGYIPKCSKKLEKIINNMGFNVNHKKTRLQFKNSRQVVTGITTNKKINVNKDYYKNIRNICNYFFTTGSFTNSLIDIDGNVIYKDLSINQLEGMISYIMQIRKEEYNISNKKDLYKSIKEEKDFEIKGVIELYRKFLFFKNFVALEKPLILTEGKTDPIYLKFALKNLIKQNKNPLGDELDIIKIKDSEYGFLGKFIKGNGSSIYKDQFLKQHYEKIINLFIKPKHPVIIFLDNDSGFDQLFKNYITNITYGHIRNNLYIMTLKNKGDEIEDLFFKKTLGVKLNGKTFNRAPKADKNKHYNKFYFATKVVAKDWENINFKKFINVFNDIKNIIDDYKSK